MARPRRDEPHGPIAQIVRFPAALGHAAGAEQSVGDLAVARRLKPAVERAQGERRAVRAAATGKRRRVGPGERPVKPRQSRSAAAARMSNNRSSGRTTQGDSLACCFEDVQAEQAAAPIDSRSGPSSARAGPRDKDQARRFGASEIGGRPGSIRDHARQARRRPESWPFARDWARALRNRTPQRRAKPPASPALRGPVSARSASARRRSKVRVAAQKFPGEARGVERPQVLIGAGDRQSARGMERPPPSDTPSSASAGR